ncbi:hypothetical protein BNATCHR2107 (nucleomorph) [Bigelowiella natans]|uniref:Uncharacterized protein n=1 Tax=Bigelowiella natans TaxID=227086 RepID=Q3LW46_BIGNA|nr:hypothetical protein BNATCHR2107 [Bigelowiella natans]ABA27319.1 hypothetical protein [Bigelowiella natans]
MKGLYKKRIQHLLFTKRIKNFKKNLQKSQNKKIKINYFRNFINNLKIFNNKKKNDSSIKDKNNIKNITPSKIVFIEKEFALYISKLFLSNKIYKSMTKIRCYNFCFSLGYNRIDNTKFFKWMKSRQKISKSILIHNLLYKIHSLKFYETEYKELKSKKTIDRTRK